MNFKHTMQAIGKGVFPEHPHTAKVIFVNIARNLYPNNDKYAYKAQDEMVESFNIKQAESGLSIIET